MFSLFILAGIAISLYGCWEILGTVNFVRNCPERAKGIFTGYATEEVVSRSTSTSPSGDLNFEDTTSYMSYPQFEFVGKDGLTQHVTESKNHIFERFKPGQEVDVIVSPYGDHRLAGFYSLYFRDLCILILGLGFILVPLLLWRGLIPLLDTPAGMRMEQFARTQYKTIADLKVGPFTVPTFFKGIAFFIAFMIFLALINSLIPFIKELHLGFGWGLIDALKEKRYDEARTLILQKKGINKVNKYNRTPLILALEAGRSDLARLLIEAGADVNIKSKMYMTPLRIATQAGDLEMVKLLLAKGASPDAPEDEYPPVFYAIMDGNDDIARALIESKCDLARRYISGELRLTIGDVTIRHRKPELTDLVRRRGGVFTSPP
jgi:hypothetical protein